MILLNPKQHKVEYPGDERSKEMMLKTIAFFEEKGRGKIKKDDHERVWYPTSWSSRRTRGSSPTCSPRRRTRWARTPAGTPTATATSTRSSPSTAWPTGTPGRCPSSGLGPHLDERERGGEEEDGAAAAGRRHLRLRALGEGARRRPLLDRDVPEAAGGRQVPRQRAQVLYRQRQRGGAGLHLRQDGPTPTTTSSSRSAPSTAATSW